MILKVDESSRSQNETSYFSSFKALFPLSRFPLINDTVTSLFGALAWTSQQTCCLWWMWNVAKLPTLNLPFASRLIVLHHFHPEHLICMGWFVASPTDMYSMTPGRWSRPPHCDTHHPAPSYHIHCSPSKLKMHQGTDQMHDPQLYWSEWWSCQEKGLGGRRGLIDWRWREEEGWIGGKSPSLLLSFSFFSSLPYCRLLDHPQHTLSHFFYLLLFPQQTHPSYAVWVE